MGNYTYNSTDYLLFDKAVTAHVAHNRWRNANRFQDVIYNRKNPFTSVINPLFFGLEEKDIARAIIYVDKDTLLVTLSKTEKQPGDTGYIEDLLDFVTAPASQCDLCTKAYFWDEDVFRDRHHMELDEMRKKFTRQNEWMMPKVSDDLFSFDLDMLSMLFPDVREMFLSSADSVYYEYLDKLRVFFSQYSAEREWSIFNRESSSDEICIVNLGGIRYIGGRGIPHFGDLTELGSAKRDLQRPGIYTVSCTGLRVDRDWGTSGGYKIIQATGYDVIERVVSFD